MWARLQSLSAVLLALLLLVHLVGVWPATSGRQAWIAAWVERSGAHTLGVLILGLMLLHAALGLARMRPSAPGPSVAGPGMARLQLATGLATALFVGIHLLQLQWPGAGPHRGAAHAYAVLRQSLGAPLWIFGYLAGITATTFHVAHGLSRLPFTWGWPANPRHVRLARYVAGLAGLVLWLAWLEVLAHLAIGSGLFGAPAPPSHAPS